MNKNNLVLYVSVFGLMMAVSLLLISVGVLGYGLGLLAGGLVLFNLSLLLPLALFVGAVARRLDIVVETGNDAQFFKENGRKPAEKEKAAVK